MGVKILPSGWNSQYFLPVLTYIILGLLIVLKQASLYYNIKDVLLPLVTILEFLCDSTYPVETAPLNNKRM